MSVFYNDFDARACATLREMMAAGLIGDGTVDERDVATIQPRELAGYDRVHLFAGIGGFELAARLAGWPGGVQLWTGGFPCQPHSLAGRRKGTADDRYLWPEFERLIRGCRPEFVLIENVAAIDSEPDLVLDRMLSDLEALGYETWSAEIPACAVDAAHERNRVWVMAYCDVSTRRKIARSAYGDEGADAGRRSHNNHRFAGDDKGAVANAKHGRCGRGNSQRPWSSADVSPGAGAVGNAEDIGRPARRAGVQSSGLLACEPCGPSGWIACHDGKFRRLPLGLLDPAVVLADGLPARTLALHGLGNSIVPAVAAEILKAMLP